MKSLYDVAIVGSGPAGLFAALRLANQGLQVVLIDKGPDLDIRIEQSLRNEVTPEGFGGSGGFSDGKVIFSAETGGRLSELVNLNVLDNYLKQAYNIWKQYSSDIEVDNYMNLSAHSLVNEAKQSGIHLIVSDTYHIGSDLLPKVLRRMRDYLLKSKITLLMDSDVKNIVTHKNELVCLGLSNGDTIVAQYVVVGPGRGGARWLAGEAERLGLKQSNTPVDIGVRVEVPSEVTKKYTDALYEFKLRYKTPSYNDWVRTFCVCPNGQVVEEKHGDTTLVNGYSNKKKNSGNTNFAFLSSIKLGPPISLPLEFSHNITRTVNSIANGTLVQTFGDLLNHKRSTQMSLSNNKVKPTLTTASPGDLSLAYPHRFVVNIIEGLEAISVLMPGINSNSTLLYAPEIKMYSSMVAVDENMQTDIPGLYVLGDGAGLTRGIAQSCVTGLVAADHILEQQ